MLYQVVSSTKYCGHVKGGYGFRCNKKISDDCENQCTMLSECIGYSFNGKDHCVLWPSSGSCPTGWNSHSGHVVKSANDLVASNANGFNCYARGT